MDPPTESNLDTYGALLRLEQLILEPPRTWVGGMLYTALCRNYPEAFAAMARELNPALYQEEITRERRLRKTTLQLGREQRVRRKGLLAALKAAAKVNRK